MTLGIFVQKSTKQRAQYSFHVAVVTIIIRSFVQKIRNMDSDLGRRLSGRSSFLILVFIALLCSNVRSSRPNAFGCNL